MQFTQLVAGDPPQPEKEGCPRLLHIIAQVLPGLDVDILDDVGRIDPAAKAPVEPEGDQPAQTFPVLGQQFHPARRIALGGSLQQSVNLVRFRGHRVHNDVIAQNARR